MATCLLVSLERGGFIAFVLISIIRLDLRKEMLLFVTMDSALHCEIQSVALLFRFREALRLNQFLK